MLIHTIFGLAIALLCAYLSFSNKHPLNDEVREARMSSARARGEQRESEVSAELSWHLTRLCGEDWAVLDGLILIHAPGSAFPTAEIDHLAITPFGVFVVETKHWIGVVTHGETDDTVTLSTVDGQRFVRTSPMKQNAELGSEAKRPSPPKAADETVISRAIQEESRALTYFDGSRL